MGELAVRLNDMTVKAQSHDGNIRAIFSKEGLRISLRPGVFEEYDTDEMASQLTGLLRKIELRYRQSYKEITESFDVTIPIDPRHAASEVERNYLTEAANVTLVGATERKLVRIRAVGMRGWQCRIERGALTQLGEEEFVNEVNGAANKLVKDYQQSLRKLKKKHYKTGW